MTKHHNYKSKTYCRLMNLTFQINQKQSVVYGQLAELDLSAHAWSLVLHASIGHSFIQIMTFRTTAQISNTVLPADLHFRAIYIAQLP